MSKKRWGTWGHDDREDDNPWKKRKWGDNHEDNYNNSWGNKKINNTKIFNAQQQNFDFKLHSNNHLISPHVSMLVNNYLIKVTVMSSLSSSCMMSTFSSLAKNKIAKKHLIESVVSKSATIFSSNNDPFAWSFLKTRS